MDLIFPLSESCLNWTIGYFGLGTGVPSGPHAAAAHYI